MAVSSDFQSFIDEVAASNDIVDFISEYTKVKQVGNRFQALCPLHNDKKSPSLSISRDKQVFHCFGCGAGGNVIHFAMAMEHLDFMDALKLLADRAHLAMPENRSPQDKRYTRSRVDKKQLIYQINADAARFFHSCLIGETGRAALAYLKERHIKNATIQHFGLGYAPDGWTTLIEHLKAKGYREHDMLEAGVVKMRDNGTYFDAFIDRVMFPILDVRGNVIGFGGRIMTERANTGKYLNTAETLAFKKKENLFGLNFAKNDPSGTLLLMEGYMDVISLHQAGITNAVASLGTAFTPEQAALVKRYAGKAVLCYDADEAGKKATLRAGEILTDAGIKTRVLAITGGKDPDEFVNAQGAEMFRVLIEEAKPLITYRIDEIRKQYHLDVDEEKIEFIEALANIFASIKNPVEREVYIDQAARETGITAAAISAEVSQLDRRRQQVQARKEARDARRQYEERTGGRRDLDRMGVYNAERKLLNLMCDKKVFAMATSAGLQPSDFSTELHRELAAAIWKLAAGGKDVEATDLLQQFAPEQCGAVTDILLSDTFTTHKERAAEVPLACVLQAKNRNLQNQSLKAGDLDALQQQLNELAQRKKGRNA